MHELRGILSVFFLFVLFPLAGQNKEILVQWTDKGIELDGLLREEEWGETTTATGFWQHFPTDSLPSSYQTEVRMLYDAKYLYVGIKVLAPGRDYVVPSLRRDQAGPGNDHITLSFDTFNDGQNSFIFSTNPSGVQLDALISNGGADFSFFNTSWDVKWENYSRIFDDHYIAEMKIPLASFKFKQGETKWRFNSFRFDSQSNQWSTWTPIPQNQDILNLAFMGDMIFERPLEKSKTPFSLIPYASGILSKDYEADQWDNGVDFGGDAKVPIGNSLNLDLTVNPDFSQVEVDELIVNLTRFEVFLPEKRQFFIDNGDLFAGFGNSRDANPFFSRRIGIAEDLEENTIENQIIGGARLSGKLTRDLRIGLLNIQTAEDRANEIPTNNNTVIALQQKLFSRSNIGFIFVNRQVTRDRDYVEESEQYNRIVGVDFNLASDDNTWVGKYYLHKSFTPGSGSADFSSGAFLEYKSRKLNARLGSTYIGEDFQADLGFVNRTDILQLDPVIQTIFYPENSRVNTHSLELRASSTWSLERDFLNTDAFVDLEYQISFRDQSMIEMAINHRYTYLLEEFDPTDSDDAVPLPADTDYSNTKFDLSYGSDRRKPFSFWVRTDIGQFYNGYRYSLASNLRLRLQPYFTASLNASLNYIDLPDPYPESPIYLIGPKAEFTFSKNLFWSTFIQYSSQSEDFSVNSRLQWRFRPLSDLFVVYNDNYRTSPFSPRTRALIVKFTYWINI